MEFLSPSTDPPRPEGAEQPANGEAQPPVQTARRRPQLDLSRIAPPENLESVQIEELTIDGICGVY